MTTLKANKLTEGHNLLWESSRMMLPEHKEVIRQHRQKRLKKEKPLLDEQAIEMIERTLLHAYENSLFVHIHLYHPYETVVLKGEIAKLEQHRLQLKLKNNETEWIALNDIVNIDVI